MTTLSGHHHLDLTDYRALAEFRHQIRCFLHFSEQVARTAGLEPQQHQLLLAIKGAAGGVRPCIGDLAEQMQIQHHSAVELTGRLARKGLIQRIRGSNDRRQVQVRLTARGERVLRQLTIHNRAELRSAAPALVAVLRKIANRARPKAAVAKSRASGKRAAKAVKA